MADNYLIISDLQIPFEAEFALEFCKYLKRHYNVADDNVLGIGDEVDQYFGSLYQKDCNALLTPTSEIGISIEKLKMWTKTFPKMRVCMSNHGMRWAKKAAEAEIPYQMLRMYQDVLQIPKTWRYKLEWIINTKHKFRIIHGMGYSGQNGHINAAMDSGMSTAIGHLHAHMGIAHLRKGISNRYAPAQKIWGMNTGCLIDTESFAFHYGKDNRNKPALGASVVVNSGATPIVVPYDV